MTEETTSEFLSRIAGAGDRRLPAADTDRLRAISDRYPYFSLAAQLLLERGQGLDDNERRRLKARVAFSAGGQAALADAVYAGEWNDIYPPPATPKAPATEDAIDVFLKTYGTSTPEEESMLERLIFNPTPDYAEMLAREEQSNMPDDTADAAPDSQDARINAFILDRHPASPRHHTDTTEEDDIETTAETTAPITPPEHTDDTLLSESLAKIFIKQQRYDRAYEIISDLNLKYPKKSVYFADQLRFLRKLILNQRHLGGGEPHKGAK